MNLLFKNLFMIFFLLLVIFSIDSVAQQTASDDISQSFLQTVQNDDIEHITALLESKVGITDELIRSAAMSAAYSGKGDVLELLMEETNMIEKAGHICPDYTFNVRAEYFDSPFNRATVDDALGSFLGHTTTLELSFFLQRYNSSTPEISSIRGTGISRGFQVNNEVSNVEEIDFVVIMDVIQTAVRNGYEQLKSEYEIQRQQGFLHQQLITSTVIKWWDHQIQIPLGRSHYIQEGDVFNVYGTRARNYSNRCSIARLHGPPLNTATVVEVIDQDNAILEVNENTRGYFGDIVTFSVDLESRTQVFERVLRLGYMPSFSIAFHNSDRMLTEDITAYIKYFLAIEAPNFGFRVTEEE